MAINAPDLTRQAPRSPRVRLGGYVILPRMLDKGRAVLAGKNGEYNFACPLDQQFGKGDGEILEWIAQHAKPTRTASEIAAWSAHQEQRAPDNPGSRAFFNDVHSKVAPKRTDIATWFDLLDLDDYASFGGKV